MATGKNNDLEILVTDDGSPTLLDRALNVTYHSKFGAVSESRHVFIEHGLHYALNTFGKRLNILEVGFGTGLNALLSLSESLKNGLELNYTAIEKFPLDPELHKRLSYANSVDEKSAALFAGIIQADWGRAFEASGQFKITKCLADVNGSSLPEGIHAVYFDAFAPANAPEMWTPALFSKLYNSMQGKGCLVTFCAKGEVKRMLKASGFQVEALPGPPGKKEMTRAVKP